MIDRGLSQTFQVSELLRRVLGRFLFSRVVCQMMLSSSLGSSLHFWFDPPEAPVLKAAP